MRLKSLRRQIALLGELTEEVLPHTPPRPAHKSVVYGRRRAVFGRAVAPPTTALQHMQDAADHPSIVRPLFAAHVRRQKWLNLSPLFVAEPKQVASHDLCSPQAGDQRITIRFAPQAV